MEIPYSYWTGTQWVPSSIHVDEPMGAIWHVFHIVLCVLTWGVWIPFYVLFAWSSYWDYRNRAKEAVEQIERYYESLGVM